MSTTAGSTLAAIAEVDVVPVAGVGAGVALLLDGDELPVAGLVVAEPVAAVAGAV
jgi:hypothetical protein